MLLPARRAAARPGPTSPSYVIAVRAQVAGGQPYARGPQSKAVTLVLGQPQQAAEYNLTVDTGSGTLSVGCWTPWAAANCARSGRPGGMDKAFNLTAAGSAVVVPLEPGPACASCPLPGTLPGATQGMCSFNQTVRRWSSASLALALLPAWPSRCCRCAGRARRRAAPTARHRPPFSSCSSRAAKGITGRAA